MSEYIRCPMYGALMTVLTNGHMCPCCGYRFPAQTVTQSCGTSAEYVEIVRCKDCKHYKKDIKCVGGHYNGCDAWIDEGCATEVDENGYCYLAERKDRE